MTHTPNETILIDTLKHVRAIIVDGANVGFNHADGDWAERLFASQAVTFKALEVVGVIKVTRVPLTPPVLSPEYLIELHRIAKDEFWRHTWALRVNLWCAGYIVAKPMQGTGYVLTDKGREALK